MILDSVRQSLLRCPLCRKKIAFAKQEPKMNLCLTSDIAWCKHCDIKWQLGKMDLGRWNYNKHPDGSKGTAGQSATTWNCHTLWALMETLSTSRACPPPRVPKYFDIFEVVLYGRRLPIIEGGRVHEDTLAQMDFRDTVHFVINRRGYIASGQNTFTRLCLALSDAERARYDSVRSTLYSA